MSADPVREVLARCADELENSERYRHIPADKTLSGGEVWVLVFEAARQLFGGPALEALRRHLRVDQVQFWHATRKEMADALRAAAGSNYASDGDLLVTAMRTESEGYRQRLCAAVGLGVEPPVSGDMHSIVSAVESELRVQALEIERLRGEMERLRARATD